MLPKYNRLENAIGTRHNYIVCICSCYNLVGSQLIRSFVVAQANCEVDSRYPTPCSIELINPAHQQPQEATFLPPRKRVHHLPERLDIQNNPQVLTQDMSFAS